MSKAAFSKKSSAKKPKKNRISDLRSGRSRPKFNKPSVSSSAASSVVPSVPPTSILTSRAEPWNHKQFLQRVATFNSLKWHIKRTDITPLICARFGWQCVGSNSLQCTGCGTKVDYKTNPLWTAEINDKAAASFLENIKKRHTAECVWKENPCDESFELLPTDHNVLKLELIENMKSWTKTNNEELYVIPKLDPKSKQLLLQSIEPMHRQFEAKRGCSSWTQYASCCTLMLLSGSGWHLASNKTLHFVECKYCNKCVSLQSYECKTMTAILPENIHNVSFHDNSPQIKIQQNSFLRAINEDDDEDDTNNNIDDDDGKELETSIFGNIYQKCSDPMDADDDEEGEESDAPELDISAILSRELPLNDTDSVMHRLSKLGLKIDVSIRRSHNFQIYETRSLQKQAHFSSDCAESACSSKSPSSTMEMSPSPAPPSVSTFGMVPIRSSFGGGGFGMSSIASSALNWPKMSVLNSTATSMAQSVDSNHNTNSNGNSAVKSVGKKTKKKRKRSRLEMEQMDQVKEEEVNDENHNNNNSKPPKRGWTWGGIAVNGGNGGDKKSKKKENEDGGPSRKKMKIQSNHNTKSNDPTVTQQNESRKKKNKRRSRKRKSTELDNDLFMGSIAEEPDVPMKKRKIVGNDNSNSSNTSTASSSVSTTVSMSPSQSQSQSQSGSSSSTPSIGTPGGKKRKSRKRRFNDVFNHSIDEGIDEEDENGRDKKDEEDDDDEDDDIVHEQKDAVPSLVKPIRSRKKMRLDTPTVGTQLYFDPIKSHNAHCPFVRMHQYQKESVPGYVYALRLMPQDIMYIKQIVEQRKKEENE